MWFDSRGAVCTVSGSGLGSHFSQGSAGQRVHVCVPWRSAKPQAASAAPVVRLLSWAASLQASSVFTFVVS